MEKNTIKQYFRSGSRPTQEQFYDLIDTCYNENYSVHVSGYEVKPQIDVQSSIKSIVYKNGKSHLVPYFRNINVPETRTYHYAIACSNLGPEFNLVKISMYIKLPENLTYETKDKTNSVKITQKVTIKSIRFYNGFENFLSVEGSDIPDGPQMNFAPNMLQKEWQGISVDITIHYDIASQIAVSDKFDLSESNPNDLLHEFGGLGCEFKISKT